MMQDVRKLMDPELKWAIGLAVSICTAFTLAMIASFRNLASRMSDNSKDLHTRIDDVKEKYVRRDDLDGHIKRIEENLSDMRHENREAHRQLLAVLTTNHKGS